MSDDDKISWAILIGVLLFVALVVPLQLSQDNDARFGADTKNVIRRLMK